MSKNHKKTEPLKPKRYPSVPRLASAWYQEQIDCESFAATRGGFMITADSETIWNGYKSQVLVQRNRSLGLVMALRQSAASLGKAALIVMERALRTEEEILRDYSNSGSTQGVVKPSYNPHPYIRINSLADPLLATCGVETLRPMVMESSVKVLEFQLWWTNRYPRHGMWALDRAWKEETLMLGNIGLSIPEDLEEKLLVLKATRRLLGK